LEIIENKFGIKGIPMLPIRMIENWLLGDEDAYTISFGRKPHSPKLPKKPEFIWGSKYDINSDYPKHYLKRVLNQYNELIETTNYINIMENINIDRLKETCSYSFGKFYEQIITME
jgi:hypothetical protein